MTVKRGGDLDSVHRSEPEDGAVAARDKPRVVIFNRESGSKVEIIELPESASLGDLFCHSGTRWQVTATRTGDRVLIVRPAEA
jgi:hypothetical protein